MTALLTVALLLVAPVRVPPSDTVPSPPVDQTLAAQDPCPLLGLPSGCSQPPPPPPPPPPTATVVEGDTFSQLAVAWGVDLAIVEAANADTVQDPDMLQPGQVLKMPGGTAPPPPPPPPATPQPAPSRTTGGPAANVAPAPRPAVGSVGNHFSFGYCTWYVANRRPIPWFGDAGQWGPNAARMGFSEGRTPQVGAIMVSWEGPIGHVAYVEAVNGDGSFVVTEMNYAAWNVVDRRVVWLNRVPLETFIY